MAFHCDADTGWAGNGVTSWLVDELIGASLLSALVALYIWASGRHAERMRVANENLDAANARLGEQNARFGDRLTSWHKNPGHQPNSEGNIGIGPS